MKKIYVLFMLLSFFLIGCEKVQEIGEPTFKQSGNFNNHLTIVINSGYEIDIGGKPVSLIGLNTCPKQDDLMIKILGSSLNDGATSCVVITPQTNSVKVMLALESGITTEEWTVKRLPEYNGATSLYRPDGSPVVSY